MSKDKTIWNLVVDLLSFSDGTLPVSISVDGGVTLEQLILIIDDKKLEGEYAIKDLIDYFRLNYVNPNIVVKIISKSNIYSINLIGKKNGRCVLIHYP